MCRFRSSTAPGVNKSRPRQPAWYTSSCVSFRAPRKTPCEISKIWKNAITKSRGKNSNYFTLPPSGSRGSSKNGAGWQWLSEASFGRWINHTDRANNHIPQQPSEMQSWSPQPLNLRPQKVRYNPISSPLRSKNPPSSTCKRKNFFSNAALVQKSKSLRAFQKRRHHKKRRKCRQLSPSTATPFWLRYQSRSLLLNMGTWKQRDFRV